MVNKPSQPSESTDYQPPSDEALKYVDLDDDIIAAVCDVNTDDLPLWSDVVYEGEDWVQFNADYSDDDDPTLYRHKDVGAFIDRTISTGQVFTAIEVMAAERGRIDKPTDDLDEWKKAYKNLRSKADTWLPRLDNSRDFDVGRTWESIRQSYADARNKSERSKVDRAAAEKLRREVGYATTEDNGELFVFENGIYKSVGESKTREILNSRDALYYEATTDRRKRIIDTLKGLTTLQREELEADEGHIVVDNGVLDIANDRFYDKHRKHFKALRKLNVDYDPNADEPEVFLDYLDSVVESEEEKKKLQEFAGYTLKHWEIDHRKALFLVGPTSSGKSTFINVIKMIHDDDAVSSLTPHQLVEEQYNSMIYGSWLNARNDISSAVIENSGQLKEIIGGDTIKIEPKFKDSFTYDVKAKHIYAGNQLPTASTDDAAFYQRVMLVSMPRTIPRDERDSELLDKIEEEKSGILNWMLEGLERLEEQDGFTNDRSPSDTEEMWSRWSNSVKMFKSDCIEVTGDKDDKVSKSRMMEMFNTYAQHRGMPSASQQTLTKTLSSYTGVSHTERGGHDDSGLIEGVSFSESGQDLFEFTVGKRDNLEDVFTY